MNLTADLHPGNILVTLDPPPGPLLSTAAYLVDRFHPFGLTVPSSWREPGIVLLDVGAPIWTPAECLLRMLHSSGRPLASLCHMAVPEMCMLHKEQDKPYD